MSEIRCSHCGMIIKRNVFCSNSCKVMFHKKKKRKAIKFLNEASKSDKQKARKFVGKP